MDNKTARQDLETVIRVEDLALGSMRKLRAIQDWLRAEATRTEAPAGGEVCRCIGPGNGCCCDRCDPNPEAPASTHPLAMVPNDTTALLTNGLANIRDTKASAETLRNMADLTLRHATPSATPEPGNEWISEAEAFWVRGFQGWKGKDFYNHEFSIQKSSLASEDCIWFGLSAADPKVLHGDARKLGVQTGTTSGWVRYPIPEEVSLNTRMHLSRDQVKALLPVLHHFVQTGDLPQPTKAQEGSGDE